MTAGVRTLRPGQEVQGGEGRKHGPEPVQIDPANKSLVSFFMALTVVAGVIAFLKLGRDEDPPFTIRIMVVQTSWPGASAEETLPERTERLEQTSFIDCETSLGQSTLFVHLDSATPANEAPTIWKNVRNPVGACDTLCRRARLVPVSM